MKLTIALLLLALAAVGCMRVPPGTRLVITDHPEPYCAGRNENCYLVASTTLVVVTGQPTKVIMHELCHAHQDEEVREELGIVPSIDLHEWYQTKEAARYATVIAGQPHPDWGYLLDAETQSLLERFAEACGRYLARDPRFPLDAVDTAFFKAEGF